MLSLVKPPHCLLFLFGLLLLFVVSLFIFFFYKMWYFCDYIDITLLDNQEKMSVSCTSETIIPKMKWQNPQNRVITIELSRGCLHANIFLFYTQLNVVYEKSHYTRSLFEHLFVFCTWKTTAAECTRRIMVSWQGEGDKWHVSYQQAPRASPKSNYR